MMMMEPLTTLWLVGLACAALNRREWVERARELREDFAWELAPCVKYAALDGVRFVARNVLRLIFPAFTGIRAGVHLRLLSRPITDRLIALRTEAQARGERPLIARMALPLFSALCREWRGEPFGPALLHGDLWERERGFLLFGMLVKWDDTVSERAIALDAEHLETGEPRHSFAQDNYTAVYV